MEFIFQITDFFWQNGRRVSTGTGNSDAHVLWAMPKGRTGQQKVPILKKATGLCISRSYYSTMTCGLSAVAGWWRGCPIRTTDCTDEDSRSLKHKNFHKLFPFCTCSLAEPKWFNFVSFSTFFLYYIVFWDLCIQKLM